MFPSFITFGLSLILLSHLTKAALAPSYPEPGTVWTVGKEYDITWEEDGAKPSMKKGWKNFKIDLMTGDNMDQVFLTNVASNLSAASGSTTFKYTAPNVSPYSPIYFFMFTNEEGENAWTTRFAIVGEDGKQEAPANQKQPNGEKIPWGVGKLAVKAASVNEEDNDTSSGPTSSEEDQEIKAATVKNELVDDGGDDTVALSEGSKDSSAPEESDDGKIKAAAILPENNVSNATNSLNIKIHHLIFAMTLVFFATFF
ncbi:hypothetical protein BDA99DRAFT_194091 [Phascolomyces articulosus]|uniref:Yeast cell wall synthesis Kre9/Knh1-like N-terminal domain-containing protein n=1 Tax=Phascolomyces articulosus TaxID=60185 RepID=A0AAD5PJ43_9FUNG|nr:hypothetical protein BDA99DRAFT_194091 [Phascolomyces articulosus]